MASLADVHDGLEGVLAFATEIAEPDRDGGSLRYRGIDVEQLVGTLPFEAVWGLLVDDHPECPLVASPALALPLHTGDVRVDLQAAVAALVDTPVAETRTQLSQISAQAIEYVAQAARGGNLPPVPERDVARGGTM